MPPLLTLFRFVLNRRVVLLVAFLVVLLLAAQRLIGDLIALETYAAQGTLGALVAAVQLRKMLRPVDWSKAAGALIGAGLAEGIHGVASSGGIGSGCQCVGLKAIAADGNTHLQVLALNLAKPTPCLYPTNTYPSADLGSVSPTLRHALISQSPWLKWPAIR